MVKRFIQLAAVLTLMVAGFFVATLGEPSTASAHNGQISISCSQVSFTFDSFPSGQNVISYSVKVDGLDFSQGVLTISSSGAKNVPLNLTGDHTIKAQASWTADGGGSVSKEQDIECGTPTTTTVNHTTTVTQPPPPPVTSTVTVTQPPVTVTTTVPSPPVVVVKWKTRTIVKWKTYTKVIHRYTIKRTKCGCPIGTKLWHGHCHHTVPGSG